MTLSTVTVDVLDPTPPYEQLRRQLADLIGSGVLSAGDRLPPVRQLAADLGLAVGTVADDRALAAHAEAGAGGGGRRLPRPGACAGHHGRGCRRDGSPGRRPLTVAPGR